MAQAKEVELDESKIPNKKAKELVSEEMVAAAEAAAKESRMAEEDQTSGVGVLRKKGGGSGLAGSDMENSDIPYPVEVHGEDFEFYGPSGMAAKIPDGTEISPYSSDQEFVIDPELVKFLRFDKPGRNLPKKRLYTVKALHKDGRFVQLPFEAQIMNNAGGDPEDAIGLRRFQRMGIHVFIDWDTLVPIYCAARDCWARAAGPGSNFVGFCTMKHAKHTMPNRFRGGEDGEISQGLFASGVTTQNVWNA